MGKPVVLLFALVGALAAAIGKGDAARESHLLAEIHDYRRITWHWQRVTGRPRTPAAFREREALNPRYRRWVLRLWRTRAHRVWRHARKPPHRAAWRCIQRYEADWHDRGGPYYGGLQMDLAFQQRYGAYLLRRKGTADRWSPLEQMWVAERALRAGRGFWPWPNAARLCGLL